MSGAVACLSLLPGCRSLMTAATMEFAWSSMWLAAPENHTAGS